MFPPALRGGVPTCIREDHMQRDFLSIRALPILALFAAFLSTPAFAQFQARPDPAEAGRSAPA